MNRETITKVLNEWMRRYVHEPERFEHEIKTVRDFWTEHTNGEEPSYGVESAVYMEKIAEELGLA